MRRGKIKTGDTRKPPPLQCNQGDLLCCCYDLYLLCLVEKERDGVAMGTLVGSGGGRVIISPVKGKTDMDYCVFWASKGYELH